VVALLRLYLHICYIYILLTTALGGQRRQHQCVEVCWSLRKASSFHQCALRPKPQSSVKMRSACQCQQSLATQCVSSTSRCDCACAFAFGPRFQNEAATKRRMRRAVSLKKGGGRIFASALHSGGRGPRASFFLLSSRKFQPGRPDSRAQQNSIVCFKRLASCAELLKYVSGGPVWWLAPPV
jgi:hypothetical protein